MNSERDAFARTAKRLRTGTKLTQKEAEKILARSLEKADRKQRK